MKTLVFSLFSFISLVGFCQEWELKKIGDGIKVYTKPVAGSEFDAFKAEMEIKATIEQLQYVLSHMYLFPDLTPNTLELKLLNQPNDSTLIQYSVSDAPWPLDDRDGVYQMQFKKQHNGGFRIESVAKPKYIPEKDGLVRIQKSNSSWDVVPAKDGLVRITYTVSAEPGGNLPDWLVNSAATEIPYETFENLQRIIKKI